MEQAALHVGLSNLLLHILCKLVLCVEYIAHSPSCTTCFSIHPDKGRIQGFMHPTLGLHAHQRPTASYQAVQKQYQ